MVASAFNGVGKQRGVAEETMKEFARKSMIGVSDNSSERGIDEISGGLRF